MPKLTQYPFLIISIISLFFSYSCGPKKVTPQSKMHDSVMIIHDEVMPKMKDIYRLRKKLKKKGAQTNSPSETLEINNLIEALEEADNSMMDWMAYYDEPDEGAEGAMEYLSEEKSKIEKVENDMLSAIENAKKVLDVE